MMATGGDALGMWMLTN
ncbi:Protein of unknown function [Lactobacillus helveticus CIRM-BIA 104]|uniref:Uncharacterized protein n=1 Tax=Lactobacillus helveticus CIRM-BIA 104 TaxID=1226333 RepID=U6FCM2_LACHE|nr:Protein of unknown function [Lactobacillus helveticus CIRM-BIA 104]